MNAPNDHPHTPGAAGANHDLGFALPAPTQIGRGRLLLVGLGAVGLLGGAFLLAYLPRSAAAQKLAHEADAARTAAPRLAVVKPKLVSSDHVLRLPGSVQPLEETVLYARASGYLRKWYVDMGGRVAAGALLAEIETPEVDQELLQARAALAQAKANLLQAEANRGLASTQLSRTTKLVQEGLSPQQELDQTQAQATVGNAGVVVAQAMVAAQEANIRRLVDLESFSRVTAPFAGTITARSVERGSLVTAGNTTPLFHLAAMDPVRVFIQVPQDIAPSVTAGIAVKVSVHEFPDKHFEGHVTRTSGALDPTSRTLSTEIRVPNPTGILLSGMYADCELSLASERRVFELPATALMNDASGLRVAVVTPQNTVHLQTIGIERDLGPTVQVARGLDGSERVIQIARSDLDEGARVDVVR